jgi:uncharacterized membrane protein
MKSKATRQAETEGINVRAVLNTIAALIALAGLADSVYLTVISVTGETAACAQSTGCFEVLRSSYGRIAGVPVAALGIMGYFAAFTCAIFAGFGHQRAWKWFTITVWTMFAATLWLLYVQAFVLHAFCRFCLFSAALTFLLAGLVVATPPPDDDSGDEE